MAKVRILVLLLMVALLLFPAMAQAQPDRPCRFHGTVQINGADVEDGANITATVAGDTYTTTTPSVYGASTYSLEIAPAEGTHYDAGASITFTINGSPASGDAEWETGGNIEVNLSIGQGPIVPGGGVITAVEVTTLAAGADATADWNSTTGVLTIGIPAGPKGDTGESIVGVAGADGADAPLAFPIIALVCAIIAIFVALFSMRRRV